MLIAQIVRDSHTPCGQTAPRKLFGGIEGERRMGAAGDTLSMQNSLCNGQSSC